MQRDGNAAEGLVPATTRGGTARHQRNRDQDASAALDNPPRRLFLRLLVRDVRLSMSPLC